MNSLVNPGAIATTSHGQGRHAGTRSGRVFLSFYSDFAGRPLSVNQEVFKSEAETNQRNQAIGYLMYAYGYIKDNPMQATDVYTEQCSVNVNAKDLATMAATLADGGKNPVTRKQVMAAKNVPVRAGGHGDCRPLRRLRASGSTTRACRPRAAWAAVSSPSSPGKFGIAVISPPLDDAGNSVRAQKAIAEIVARLNANPYAVKPS